MPDSAGGMGLQPVVEGEAPDKHLSLLKNEPMPGQRRCSMGGAGPLWLLTGQLCRPIKAEALRLANLFHRPVSQYCH